MRLLISSSWGAEGEHILGFRLFVLLVQRIFLRVGGVLLIAVIVIRVASSGGSGASGGGSARRRKRLGGRRGPLHERQRIHSHCCEEGGATTSR